LARKNSSCIEQEFDVATVNFRDYRLIALTAILVSLPLVIIKQLIVICYLKRKNSNLEARLNSLNIPTIEVETPLNTLQHENDDVEYEVNEMYGITCKEVKPVSRHYRNY
jgi:hypothetical protein